MVFRFIKKMSGKGNQAKNSNYMQGDPKLNQKKQMQINSAAKLKIIEKELLKILSIQKDTLSKLNIVFNTLKKKNESQKQNKKSSSSKSKEFVNDAEEKKFKNMPPIDSINISNIDWDRLLKKLR